MSEYQYYEFAALDQPLSKEQQAQLRARSSRAVITASSFTNEYHWGDFKGDADEWMTHYFDAHVYSANWGQCDFMLSLPQDALGKSALAGFSGASFAATARAGRWIVRWSLDGDDGDVDERFNQEDGSGWMARLLPLREELLRGDLRPLYLGWLARVCSCELDDDALEPPPPPGLNALTPAQAALVEFLLIDPDLLAVAASASSEPAPRAEADAARAWSEQLPVPELRAAMRELAAGQGATMERRLRGQYAAWRRAQASPAAESARRTVAELEAGRGAAEALRLEHERQQRQARETKRRAERSRHLAVVAAQADAIWSKVDLTLQGGTGGAYAAAMAALAELAEALAEQGRDAEFRRSLLRLQAAHGKRPAWVARLEKAGWL